MRIAGFLTVVIILFGCSGKSSSDKITYQSKIFIEQSLIDYLNRNPDLSSSDSAKQTDAVDKFKRKVKVLSNEADFLKNFPVQAVDVRDTLMGDRNFIIATFIGYHDEFRDKNSLLNNMQIRINGIFQFPSQARGLVVGGRYYLKSMLYKQGKRADINYYKNENGAIYNLGVYPMAIKKLYPIKLKDRSYSL